jgi:hypothetical protein
MHATLFQHFDVQADSGRFLDLVRAQLQEVAKGRFATEKNEQLCLETYPSVNDEEAMNKNLFSQPTSTTSIFLELKRLFSLAKRAP